MLRPLFSFAAQLLWPARCAGCDGLVAPATDFCRTCALSLLTLDGGCRSCAMPAPGDRCWRCTADPPPFVGARSALAYGGPIAESILRLKHGGRSDLARPLGRTLLTAIAPDLARLDAILPVPLHPRRLRQRGYNQAIELVRGARAVAAHPPRWPPLWVCTLRRIRDTPALGRHSPQERRALVEGAFEVSRPAEVRGRRLLVVDDVMTTGATLSGCARALLEAGASEVLVATLARAL